MTDEKILKRFLKRRCKVTLAFVTAFLITGSLAMASKADPLFPKDTEVVFFLNGALGNGELESVRNIGEVKLPGYDNSIKPPIEWTPIEPSKPEVIPGLDIIKPGEPGGPTTTIPGIEIIPPGQEGGPTTKPVEPKPEVIPGLDIIKPGEPGGPTTKPTDPEKPQENVNVGNIIKENGIIFNIKENEKFINKGTITYKSNVDFDSWENDFTWGKPFIEAYAIKNNGGTVINEGTLKIEGMNDTNIAGTGHIIRLGEGVGIYQTSGTFENNGTIVIAGNGYDYDKDGYTDFSGGTGILIENGNAINNNLITSSNSYLLPNGSLMLNRGIGMKALGGVIENGKNGIIKNQEHSMLAIEKGIAINNGLIETELNGMIAFNGGTAINNGTIKAWKNEKEGHIGEAGKGLCASSINGTETVITNSETGIVYGSVLAEGGNGKIINNGKIYGTEIKISGGVIENNGIITGESTKPVVESLEGGKFVQGTNGKLDVSKFNGDLYLAGDYAENNFSDKISVGDNIAIDEHNGEIKSDSIMYDYNSTDKTLERKEFSELLNNKNIASYLEDNYMDGDLIRQELYNSLKDINTVKKFNRATNNLFGNDIYPALNKQTLEMVRFNRDTLYSQVFNQDTDKDTRIIAGADYKTFDVDSSNLSGYDTDIQSIFIGMDKQMSVNNRLGGIINVGKMKSTFEMNNAERDDMFVQANLYNIYQNNGYRLVNNLFVGVTDGDLERDLKFGDVYGRQSADIDSTYIGLNNVLTRKFDFNFFYITPKLEANFTQLMNSEIKEDGNYGLEIEKQDVTSIEAGVGIEIGKEFMLTDTLKAGVKLSGAYLAELSDPYEEVNVRLRQINHSEYIKISEYDNEDYKDISLRLELSNDSISSYAEYKYMFDDSIGTLGVSYKF